MKILKLNRFLFLHDRTLGKLEIEGSDVTFYTAELKYINNQPNISCIPCGEYQLIRRWSKKHNHHLMLLDVPQRSHILIHSGNFASSFGKSDSLGCILIGDNFSDLNNDGLPEVINSKKALAKLMKLVGEKEDLKLIISEVENV